MISLDLLETFDIFKGLNDDQLTAIQEHCQTEEYKRDERLFIEGDEAAHLWFVFEGQVDLRFELPGRTEPANDQTVSAVSAKPSIARTLGWSCFVPPYKMRLSAYCESRTCKVIKISKDDLLNLFEKDHKLGYLVTSFIVRVVGYRFQQFQDQVAKNMGESIMSSW